MNPYNLNKKKVWIAGSTGLTGKAISRRLKLENCKILKTDRNELNLCSQNDVYQWVNKNKPDVIIVCAGRCGGIKANINYPYEFLYENIMIKTNIVFAAFKHNIEKLLMLGSSCIYPRECPQPMSEGMLMSGKLEPTNQFYALSKIIGLKLCESLNIQYNKNFVSVIPCNLYGPHDSFHEINSHVPAALLSKFHKAKISDSKNVKVWGTGKVIREFLHIDDFADACVYILKNYNGKEIVNVGSGKGIKIKEFAELIKETVGYKGKIIFDKKSKDGMPEKVLNVKKINKIGWKSKISLKKGLKLFYEWYLDNQNHLRQYNYQNFEIIKENNLEERKVKELRKDNYANLPNNSKKLNLTIHFGQ